MTLKEVGAGGIKFVQSTQPSNPDVGDNWYDTDAGIYRVYADLGSGLDWRSIPPVTVTEDAVTFAESDVTVTINNTTFSGGSIKLSDGGPFPDDFEDGVDAGWSGDTGSLSAVTTPALTETQSGELNSANAFNSVSSPSLGQVTTDLVFKIQIDNQSGNRDDYVEIRPIDGSGTAVQQLQFQGDGAIDIADGNFNSFANIGETWSVDTTITVTMDFNFPNDTTTLFIDGVNIGTFDNINSTSNLNTIDWINNTTNSGETKNAYIDNSPPKTSGDALIEWDSAVPADIVSYDLATFQKTPDGETATVDVEDGAQNVLFSDIDPNFDISAVDPAKEVTLRVNLSRTSTSNNPTLDYAARRFVR